MRFRVGLVLAVILLGGHLEAQNKSFKMLLPDLLQQQKTIWTFPAQKRSWESPQPWIFTGVMAASFSLDGGVSREIRTQTRLTSFNEALESTTADFLLGSVPVVLLVTGKLTRHGEVTDLGWKSAEAAVNAFLLSHALKAATRRSRPHLGHQYGFWQGGNSYPSGHAALSWSVAAVTATHFPEKRWIPWVAYAAAGAVTFSRVSSGHHFGSDAVTGALLGFAIGRYVVH